jgi:hypothetical protein
MRNSFYQFYHETVVVLILKTNPLALQRQARRVHDCSSAPKNKKIILKTHQRRCITHICLNKNQTSFDNE